MASQYNEDEIIARLLPEATGHYMDVGCGSPENLSNTHTLYRRGWRGLCVDPRFVFNNTLSGAWKQSRPEDVVRAWAAGSSKGLVTMHVSEDHELTSIVDGWSGQKDVKVVEYVTMSLADMWREAAPREFGHSPDFLSMDIEGAEGLAIISNQWENFRPKVLCIESLEYRSGVALFHEWEPILLGHGYEFVEAGDGNLNRFYRLGVGN